MKPFRCWWLPLVFSGLIGICLFTWFRATVAFEFFPVRHRMGWEVKPIIEIGRFLARPMYEFVNHALVRIDYSYACASEWHPVFRIGFTFLWLGYSGVFWFAWTWIRPLVNRRRMVRFHTDVFTKGE